MIQVHTTSLVTADDGFREAEGIAERFGLEVHWTAWRNPGDAQWSVRITPGQDPESVLLVDRDAALKAVATTLG